MRPLSPQALQAFRLTVASGSITGAAQALGRSQPAVTRLLQNLETEIGFALFNRVKNRLVPTNASLAFYDEVQRSFERLDNLRAFARELSEGRERGLSIGAISALSNSVVPRITSEYHRANPTRRLTLLTLPSASVAQKVQLQELDVGLIVSRDLLPGLKVVRQYRLPSVCITMPGHPLTDAKTATPADLVTYPLILPVVDTVTGSQVDNAFQTHGLTPNIIVRCQLTHMISLLVMEGMGVGVVDGWMASAHRVQGGRVVLFAPELRFEISLVVNSNTEISPRIASLIAICDRTYEAEASALIGK